MFFAEIFQSGCDMIDLTIIRTHKACIGSLGRRWLFNRFLYRRIASPSFVSILFTLSNKTHVTYLKIVLLTKGMKIGNLLMNYSFGRNEAWVGFCKVIIGLASCMISHPLSYFRVLQCSFALCSEFFILPHLPSCFALLSFPFRARQCSSYTLTSLLFFFSRVYPTNARGSESSMPLRMQCYFTADNLTTHSTLFFSPTIAADTFTAISVIAEIPSIDSSERHEGFFEGKRGCFGDVLCYSLSDDTMSFTPQLPNGIANSVIANSVIAILAVISGVRLVRFIAPSASFAYIEGQTCITANQGICKKVFAWLLLLWGNSWFSRWDRINLKSYFFNGLCAEGVKTKCALNQAFWYNAPNVVITSLGCSTIAGDKPYSNVTSSFYPNSASEATSRYFSLPFPDTALHALNAQHVFVFSAIFTDFAREGGEGR